MDKKPIRYIISGITSLAVDYGMLLVLYRLFSLNIALATTIAFIFGLTTNFSLNRYWVFSGSKRGGRGIFEQSISYTLLVLFNLFVTEIIVVGLSSRGVGPEISKLITTALIATWNFFIYKKLVFRDE